MLGVAHGGGDAVECAAMMLGNLDEAVTLRNYRKAVLDIKSRVWSHIIECTLSGATIFNQLEAEPIRAAIEAECDRLIAKYEKNLREIGVQL